MIVPVKVRKIVVAYLLLVVSATLVLVAAPAEPRGALLWLAGSTLAIWICVWILGAIRARRR